MNCQPIKMKHHEGSIQNAWNFHHMCTLGGYVID